MNCQRDLESQTPIMAEKECVTCKEKLPADSFARILTGKMDIAPIARAASHLIMLLG